MLTTAWYSSFLSAFNSTCVFGYCSEWRMMSEVFCSRRTSALGSPILAVSGPAASKKNDKIFKITYQSWAWGNDPLSLPFSKALHRRKLPRTRLQLRLATPLDISNWSYGCPSHHLWLHFVTCAGLDSQKVLQKQQWSWLLSKAVIRAERPWPNSKAFFSQHLETLHLEISFGCVCVCYVCAL